MLTTRQQVQHPRRLVCGARLAQNLAADQDNGVGAQHNGGRKELEPTTCLFEGKPSDVFARWFELQHGFVDIDRDRFERDASRRHQFPTARRGGRKD